MLYWWRQLLLLWQKYPPPLFISITCLWIKCPIKELICISSYQRSSITLFPASYLLQEHLFDRLVRNEGVGSHIRDQGRTTAVGISEHLRLRAQWSKFWRVQFYTWIRPADSAVACPQLHLCGQVGRWNDSATSLKTKLSSVGVIKPSQLCLASFTTAYEYYIFTFRGYILLLQRHFCCIWWPRPFVMFPNRQFEGFHVGCLSSV